MSYNYKNPTNRLKAAQLLKRLLPLAQQQADTVLDGMKPASSLGRATLGHYHLSKCVGVHVYQGDKGGWFADLEFKGLPLGVGNVIGTPSQLPLKDREEALQDAIALLASVLKNPEPQGPAEAVDSVFAFDDIEMMVPGQMLRDMRARIGDPPTADEALIVLERARFDFAQGGPLTREVVQNLPEHALRSIRYACAVALLAGLPRYPQYEEGLPPPSRSGMH
jgi:hypothetical protein